MGDLVPNTEYIWCKIFDDVFRLILRAMARGKNEGLGPKSLEIRSTKGSRFMAISIMSSPAVNRRSRTSRSLLCSPCSSKRIGFRSLPGPDVNAEPTALKMLEKSARYG